MKKIKIILAITLFFILVTGGLYAQTNRAVSLNTAIKDAAQSIINMVERESVIALVNFNAESDKFSVYVLNELEAAILDTGYLMVVDRVETEIIRDELQFQASGALAEGSVQRAGQLLGAKYIVTGSLANAGGAPRMTVQTLAVQTAEIAAQSNTNIKVDKRVKVLLEPPKLGELVYFGGAPSKYKLGDRGPAGGYIFYDKGNNFNGWRYMEAAPADLPAAASGTHTVYAQGYGDGKENTRLIIEQIGRNNPAGAADAYRVGNFNDWYLPSFEETWLMCYYLHREGIGGFQNGKYVTSTYHETRPGYIWTIDFDGKYAIPQLDNVKLFVRAARRF